MNRRLRYFILASLVFVFVASTVNGQPAGYVEVKQIHLQASDKLGCFRENGMYDAEMLRSIIAKSDVSSYPSECADPTKSMGIDLATHTLVRYSVASDCHMRVATRVIRSEAERKFKLVINNIYGGCRAGGWRQGWVAFEKMPPDYAFEIIEVKVDRNNAPIHDPDFTWPKPESVKMRETVLDSSSNQKPSSTSIP